MTVFATATARAARRLAACLLLAAAPLLLAACDSAEERAQRHYERGIELLAEGEVERALVEFRNVFDLDGFHREARLAYANVQEERGNLREAYGQYLRLIEQYPEDMQGLRALARMSAQINNWGEAERHVLAAEQVAPGDPQVAAVRIGLGYRNATRDEDADAAAEAEAAAEALLAEHPGLSIARRVQVDARMRRQDWEPALAAIDAGLAAAPERELYMLRLGVLEALGRESEITGQLKDMEEQYPGQGLHQLLIARYVAQDRLDEAEAYLRARAEPEAAGRAARAMAAAPGARTTEPAEAQLELIAFLARWRSREAAIAETGRFIDLMPENAALLRSVRAGLEFESGRREAAMLEMEEILKEAAPSVQTDRIKVSLARMLEATGSPVGARARIEEVLEHDPTQIDALKMRAGWLIDADQTGDALVELRRALDQAPRDSEVLGLMARAHERAGNRGLMGEMLALAAEASGHAPEDSLRYVRFLLQEDKLRPAEDVLRDALRLQPGNLRLLAALGNVYLQEKDWGRAQGVIARLQSIGGAEAETLARELTARRLMGQKQKEELEHFLAGQADGTAGLGAAAAVIRLRLAEGDSAGALAYAEKLLADDPENPDLRFLHGAALLTAGQAEQAAGVFAALTAENPANERAWMALYRMRLRAGDAAAASALLARARAALPEGRELQWAAAAEAERQGDIEGAIALYEALYAADSSSLVIANNLASLMASYRSDDESLQRAYDIARRLRGTDVAAFQDTYGWIAHRLGSHEEALGYLVPAAEALSADPVVQFHAAEAYAALGRRAEALEHYRKADELIRAMEVKPPVHEAVTAALAEAERHTD